MKRILTIAAVLVAISLSAPPAQALDVAQGKKIKKSISSVALPEMPALVAQLVTQAAPADRTEVAVAAVQAAIYKSPSSAPMIVAAVSKAAPEVTEVVQKKAVELQSTTVSTIAADGRGSVVSNSGGQGNGRGGNGNGNGNSGQGGNGPSPRSGQGNGRFDPANHNPGPPLPGAGPHHNRPPHPRGGPPGLIDYSKPRPHH